MLQRLPEMIAKRLGDKIAPPDYLIWPDGVETLTLKATRAVTSEIGLKALLEAQLTGNVIKNGGRAKVFTDNPITTAHVCDQLGLRPGSTRGKEPTIFYAPPLIEEED